MNNPSQDPSEDPQAPDRLLRVEQAAELLNVSRSTGYALVASKIIPSIHMGKRAVRVPERALLKWIEDNTEPGQPGQKE